MLLALILYKKLLNNLRFTVLILRIQTISILSRIGIKIGTNFDKFLLN